MTISDKSNDIFEFQGLGDGRYLIIYTALKMQGSGVPWVGYKDLYNGLYDEMKPLIIAPYKDELDFSVIQALDSEFVVVTNYDTPRYRVLAYRMDSVNHARLLIREYSEGFAGGISPQP